MKKKTRWDQNEEYTHKENPVCPIPTGTAGTGTYCRFWYRAVNIENSQEKIMHIT
jgi:hypothetical protein